MMEPVVAGRGTMEINRKGIFYLKEQATATLEEINNQHDNPL